MKTAAKRSKPAPVAVAKKSPILITWTGLVIIARIAVPAAVYVAAGGTVYRWLGL